MRIRAYRFLAIPIAAVSIVATLQPHAPLAQIAPSAQTAPSAPTPAQLQIPPPHPPSPATYAQIVRIRYLEGDVRIARGKQDEKATGNLWEQAVTNLPLETGFSLVTGAGRAEIEFEDASTLYLAENSVLTFDDLDTTRGVPYTQLTLLAGTATVHFYPIYSGQSYLLKTPTDSVSTTYPNKSYLRIDSYLDAIAVTPLVALTPEKHLTLQVSGSAAQNAAKGQTVFYDNGAPVPSPPSSGPSAFAPWDKWVAGRVASRAAAMDAVAKASGLPTSMPGLGDMNAQGTFFPCVPYGTCWMPTAAANSDPDSDLQQSNSDPNSAPDFALALSRTSATVNPGGKIKLTVSAASTPAFVGNVTLSTALPPGFTCVTSCNDILPGATPFPLQLLVDPSVPPGDYTVVFTGDASALQHQAALIVHVLTTAVADFDLPVAAAPFPYFPCAPYGIRSIAYTGRFAHTRIVNLSLGAGVPPYAWAVCHAGAWLYRQHGYVWVVGKKRHHHPPICWVKKGRRIGYVPRHPRDVAGRPPLNRKHEGYMAGDKDKKNGPFEATDFPRGSQVDLLKSPPKDYRKPDVPPLSRADAPTIAAQELKDGLAPGHAGLTLAFDQKRQSFLLISQVAEGNKSKTVATPFAGRASSLRTTGNRVEPRPPNTRVPSTPHPPTHTSAPAHTPASHASAPHASAPHTTPAHTGGGASHTGGGGASHTGSHH